MRRAGQIFPQALIQRHENLFPQSCWLINEVGRGGSTSLVGWRSPTHSSLEARSLDMLNCLPDVLFDRLMFFRCHLPRHTSLEVRSLDILIWLPVILFTDSRLFIFKAWRQVGHFYLSLFVPRDKESSPPTPTPQEASTQCLPAARWKIRQTCGGELGWRSDAGDTTLHPLTYQYLQATLHPCTHLPRPQSTRGSRKWSVSQFFVFHVDEM